MRVGQPVALPRIVPCEVDSLLVAVEFPCEMARSLQCSANGVAGVVEPRIAPVGAEQRQAKADVAQIELSRPPSKSRHGRRRVRSPISRHRELPSSAKGHTRCPYSSGRQLPATPRFSVAGRGHLQLRISNYVRTVPRTRRVTPSRTLPVASRWQRFVMRHPETMAGDAEGEGQMAETVALQQRTLSRSCPSTTSAMARLVRARIRVRRPQALGF